MPVPTQRHAVLQCSFMAELGKVVPILPLVTKADSMTIREAAAYRREVYKKLQNPQLAGPRGTEKHPSPSFNMAITIIKTLYSQG